MSGKITRELLLATATAKGGQGKMVPPLLGQPPRANCLAMRFLTPWPCCVD